MSKFSLAMKKIESEKVRKERDSRKVPTLHLPAEYEPAAPASWDSGIRQEKNAKPEPCIVTSRYPHSIITEQYRMLRTSLKNQFVKQGVQAVMVSSSINGEGKSVTSTNLAVSLAEEDNVKVALVDADLRRGRIHEYLGFKRPEKGLSNLLAENLNPKELFLKSSRSNLCVMPRGDVPKNPSNLISSDRFRLFMAELRSYFDYIIVDAPPIMSVADPGIMAKEVDGVIFVIQIGRTPKSMIAHSNVLFKQSGANMLGYVLTNVEYQTSEYRYYSKYYDAYEDSDKKGIKDKARLHMKRAGFGFDHAEKKFTSWWHRKVLKLKVSE